MPGLVWPQGCRVMRGAALDAPESRKLTRMWGSTPSHFQLMGTEKKNRRMEYNFEASTQGVFALWSTAFRHNRLGSPNPYLLKIVPM